MNNWDRAKILVKDVINNPDEYLAELKQEWEKIDPEDREYLQAALLAIPARWLAKKYWQRKGAPEWAARGFATLGTGISLAPAKYAYEQRKRIREDEAAKRKREFNSIFSF